MKFGEPLVHFLIGNVQRNIPVWNINENLVAVLDNAKRAAKRCFRRHIPHRQTGSAAGETAIGNNGTGVKEFRVAFQFLLESKRRGAEARFHTKETNDARIALLLCPYRSSGGTAPPRS